jgi:hypothetical protein
MAGLGLLVLAFGCASGPKFDHTLSIDKRETFLGPSYAQQGELLAQSALVDGLERESEARSDAEAGRTASIIARLLAAFGGALIGWPLGEAIAQQDPHWILAAAGGALIALAIPMTIVAVADIDDAVDRHNARVRPRALVALDLELRRGRAGVSMRLAADSMRLTAPASMVRSGTTMLLQR